MSGKQKRERRRFQAHESARMEALNGLPLAYFWQRWLGHWIDLVLVIVFWAPLEFLWRRFLIHQTNIELKFDFLNVKNANLVLTDEMFRELLNKKKEINKPGEENE